jgi:membrane protease YdiL (CAAX protease family)
MSDVPLSEAAAEPKVLDIQHDTDPAQDHGKARRIPHLGHAVLFFAIAMMAIVLCMVGAFTVAHLHTQAEIVQHPDLALAAQALGYALTLALAAWIFPRLWDKGFMRGIEWNELAARRRWYWILPAAITLSALAQMASRFVREPKDSPVEEMMMTRHGAWELALFGVLLAPLVEEIAFRGFLLPALATAYDWLLLDRTPAGLQRWESSTLHSRAALLFGAVMSSAAFVLFHGPQVSFLWGPMAILMGFSIVASYVRVKTHSVACSALMHATYNLTIFLVLYIASGGFRHLEKLSK